MKMRTVTTLIALVLFHASTAWAVTVPVVQCGDHETMVMDGAAMAHDMMQHDMQSAASSDCCDDMSSFSCQLHCAGAVTGLTLTIIPIVDKRPASELPTSWVGQRLPPHSRSLLRPPQPLI